MRIGLLALATLVAPSVAAADEPADAIAIAQARDAAAERGFLVATAIPVPEHHAVVAARVYPAQPMDGVSGAVGAMRWLELGGDAARDFSTTDHAMYGITAKLVAVRGASWSLALTGAVHEVRQRMYGQLESDTRWRAAAAITGCLDAQCSALGTLALGATHADAIEWDGAGRTTHVLPVAEASVSFGTSPVRPFLEGTASPERSLAAIGVRLAFPRVAADLGIGGGTVGPLGGAPMERTTSVSVLAGVQLRL